MVFSLATNESMLEEFRYSNEPHSILINARCIISNIITRSDAGKPQLYPATTRLIICLRPLENKMEGASSFYDLGAIHPVSGE